MTEIVSPTTMRAPESFLGCVSCEEAECLDEAIDFDRSATGRFMITCLLIDFSFVFSMFVLRRARRRRSVGVTFDGDHELRQVRQWISNPDDRRTR